MAARRSMITAVLIALMVNLLLFVYIPNLHRARELHHHSMTTLSTARIDAHIIPIPNKNINGSRSTSSSSTAPLNQQQPPQPSQQKESSDLTKQDTAAVAASSSRIIKEENVVAAQEEQKSVVEESTTDKDAPEPPFDLEKFQSSTPLYSEIYHGPLTQPNQASDLNKTKIVGFITGTYAKIGMRWYDRLETLGYNNHYIICTDPETYDLFRTNFTSYRVEGSYLPPFPRAYVGLRYGKKMRRRVKMLFAHRWVYILEQLRQGHHVLVTDVDNIWSSYYDMTELEASKFDVYHALETRHPPDVFDVQGFVFCGGMGWFRASGPTMKLIEDMVTRCGIECDDQVLLNRIITYVLRVDWHRDGEEHADITEHNEDTNQTLEHFGNHFGRIVGLITKGFTGYSNTTGIQFKVWDRDFAYRGKNDPSICPENNWVSMPFVVFVSRWQGPSSKLNSYDLWDKTCPNPYTTLIDGKEKKDYAKIKGV